MKNQFHIPIDNAPKFEQVYYAHSMKLYNKERELEELNIIKKFSNNIINPNGLGYSNNMGLYFNEINNAKATICSEYRGHVGHGVYDEINHTIIKGYPCFVLRYTMNFDYNNWWIEPVVSVEIDNSNDWKISYGRIITAQDMGNLWLMHRLSATA